MVDVTEHKRIEEEKKIMAMDPSAKVIMSTGYSIEDQLAELKALGAKGFLEKPFSVESIPEKILKVLSFLRACYSNRSNRDTTAPSKEEILLIVAYQNQGYHRSKACFLSSQIQ